ncbi:MAG: putative rane protein [Acidobacteriota bacterium]|jgi:putative membrane protein|nr:putative rane protein [Acidobacteriota bacterium]
MSRNTISGATLVLAACALLAVVAFGARTGSGQNTNSSMTRNDNMHAGHGSMKLTADQRFAMEAAMGGLMEVELGRVAAQKGASDEVRQFGQRMVDDHSKGNADLMQVASAKGMTLPTALDAKHQAEMQKLSAMSGAKFDKEYVRMMVKDHREDVAEFQKEASRGMDADIKSFAARTLPTLQEHLQMIQRISDKMMLRKSGNLKTTNSNMNSNM